MASVGPGDGTSGDEDGDPYPSCLAPGRMGPERLAGLPATGYRKAAEQAPPRTGDSRESASTPP